MRTTLLQRLLTRALHLSAAAALGTFAYGPWRELPAFVDAVRWGLFPTLVVTGAWLWLGPRWRVWRRPARAAAGNAPAAAHFVPSSAYRLAQRGSRPQDERRD